VHLVTDTWRRGPLNAEQIYSRRAAIRLRRLLDECGYPTHLLERANALSSTSKIGMESCLHLLSGDVPWSWSNTHTLCVVFERDPGFFFDEEHAAKPTNAVSVISAEGGATTVWCPPAGLGSKTLTGNTKLRYVVRAVPWFKHEVPGIYVYRARPIQIEDLSPDDLYVLENDGSFEVASLDRITSDSAIFSGHTDASIRRIHLPTDDEAVPGVAGDVIGVMALR